jgi:hypothetical protein
MHTHRLRSILFLALAIALGASCGDGDSTGPEDPESGSLSFSYSGAFSGTYDVSGAARFDATGFPTYGTWAVGGRDTNTDDLAVAAFRARTAPRGDLFALLVPSVTGPGTIAICDSLMDFDCDVAVALAFNIDVQNDADPDQPFCILNAGTIEMRSLAPDRAVGGFSGTGVCFAGPTDEARAFAVSDGSFDVPLVAGFGIGGI